MTDEQEPEPCRHAEVTHYELTLFLLNTRGTQSAQDLAALLLERYWVTRRD